MHWRHRRRHVIALGTTLGGLIGALVALAITLAGPGRTIWWTPAGFVAGVFGPPFLIASLFALAALAAVALTKDVEP